MKSNGFGRGAVGHWIKIPPKGRTYNNFGRHALQYYSINTNPFEVLSDSSIHSLNKLLLPHGNVIFSTFTSIDEISSYFSNFTTRSKQHNKLIESALNKNANSTLEEISITSDVSQDDNISIDTHASFQYCDISNPQSSSPIRLIHPTNRLSQDTLFCTPIMTISSITEAISLLFTDIDFDIIHPDRARTVYKRVGALLFISMEEWLDILTMDLPDLKLTFKEFYEWNNINKIKFEKGEIVDPRDMTYDDAMILGDDFELQHLFYPNDTALRKFLREGIKYYSFHYEKDVMPMTRYDLIYELYEYLARVVEVQGLTKDGIIVCPDTMDSKVIKKTVHAAFTPTPAKDPKLQKEQLKNKYSPMKEGSPRGVMSWKKRRTASPAQTITTSTDHKDAEDNIINSQSKNITNVFDTTTTNISNDIEQEHQSSSDEKNIQAMLKVARPHFFSRSPSYGRRSKKLLRQHH